MQHFKILLTGLAGMGLVLACGGSSSATAPGSGANNGAGGFSSGLASSTPLSSLTTDETQQLCAQSDQYITHSGIRAFYCELLAVDTALLLFGTPGGSDAELQQQCSSGTAACSTTQPATTCSNLTSNCTVTVGEYGACLDDLAAFASEPSALPGCSSLTVAGQQQALMGLLMFTTSPACVTLAANCPAGVPFNAASGSSGAGGAGGGPAPT
ncbi:MAG TPA: hypothetical protein VGI10_01865 [Polyangiaceae bacterium]|jgi:hypothetical protein